MVEDLNPVRSRSVALYEHLMTYFPMYSTRPKHVEKQ